MPTSPDVKPKPDPTSLTTVQLEREIKHLRELLETRIDQMSQRAVEVIAEQRLGTTTALASADKAIVAALATTDKAILELDRDITRRLEAVNKITESKFVTYRTLLDSESQKVALAHAASDKAISKAEVFNEKRFEILTAQINELKENQSAVAGRGAGMQTSWGIAVTIITLVVIVTNVVLYISSKGG